MPIEELKTDLATNMQQLRELAKDPEVTARQLALHLRDSLWPFVEATVEEIDTLTEDFTSVLAESGDILQPETAAIFAALILACQQWVLPILQKLATADQAVRDKLPGFETMIAESADLLEQVTVEADDDEEDDGEDATEDEAEGDDGQPE